MYVLHLDGPSLGWEYLRRNPEYQRDWHLLGHEGDRYPQHWGLAYGVDPALDACSVHVVWRSDPRTLVHLVPDPAPPISDALRFSLWSLPGRKRIWHDRGRLLLTIVSGVRTLRVAIAAGVEEGSAFAYLIRSGPHASARWRAVEAGAKRLYLAEPTPRYRLYPRPDRTALLHMRALQALDGLTAGASQREIAATLFGSKAVAEGWRPDGELRARVRHLLRRGESYRRRDYRRLVQ